MVESDAETSQGARAIRNKLVELHETLLGVTVTADSPDVDAAFQLFVEIWEHRVAGGEVDWWDRKCNIGGDHLYFEGIADNDDLLRVQGGGYGFDWDRVDEIRDEFDWDSDHPVVGAWIVVVSYFLTDYRYLFL